MAREQNQYGLAEAGSEAEPEPESEAEAGASPPEQEADAGAGAEAEVGVQDAEPPMEEPRPWVIELGDVVRFNVIVLPPRQLVREYELSQMGFDVQVARARLVELRNAAVPQESMWVCARSEAFLRRVLDTVDNADL